jgi:chromosome segregation ATPase
MNSLRIKVNNINITTNQRINDLENQLNQRLRNLDSRFTSMEKIMSQIRNDVNSNRNDINNNRSNIAKNNRNIRSNSGRISENESDIDDHAKPRILIIRGPNYNRDNYEQISNEGNYIVETIESPAHKRGRIVLITNRMIRVAENLSNRTRLEVVKYKESGLFGFDQYDIIINL